LVPRDLFGDFTEAHDERNVSEVHRETTDQVSDGRNRRNEIRGQFHLTDPETGKHGTGNGVCQYQHAVEHKMVQGNRRDHQNARRPQHSDKCENLLRK